MKLPRVSGKDTVKALKKAGFEVFDQEGSHVFLHKWTISEWGQRVTIPVHGTKILKLKTLKTILEKAGLSIETFTELL